WDAGDGYGESLRVTFAASRKGNCVEVRETSARGAYLRAWPEAEAVVWTDRGPRTARAAPGRPVRVKL
ncbi:MAG: hypothetical protein AB1758_21890, partial [Candidatus Eremiobacterota bacterium]